MVDEAPELARHRARAGTGRPAVPGGTLNPRPAGLPDGPGRTRGHPAPHALRRRGPGAGLAVGGRLRRHPAEPAAPTASTTPTRTGSGLHIRVAVQAASVTAVIYLSGWGPVLSGAYAFLALENVARFRFPGAGGPPPCGACRASRVGQMAIWQAGPLVPLPVPGQRPGPHGRVHPLLHHPDGRRHHGAEGAGRSVHPPVARTGSAHSSSTPRTPRWSSDGDGVCTYVSPAITALLGMAPEEWSAGATDFVHPDDRQRVTVTASGLRSSSRRARCSSSSGWPRRRKGGGMSRPWSPTNSSGRRWPATSANVRDITERKEFEALLAHRALHDPSPAWPTASLVLDRTEQMLARSRGTGEPVAAVLHRPRQLQGRQRLAGTRGRRHGSSRRWRARFVGMLRADDTVGRLGGDEFVVLAEGGRWPRVPSRWPSGSASLSVSRSGSRATRRSPSR